MATPDPEGPQAVPPPEPHPVRVDETAREQPAEPARAAEPRLLRRAVAGRMIAGVCAGIGRYVALDPVLIRLAFVILTLAGGSGILVYLILGVVMPEERPGDPVYGPADSRVQSLRRVLGWGLLLAGAILLVGRFLPGLEPIVWPVLLLAIGAAVLSQGSR